MNIGPTISNQLRELRFKMGLTQVQIAAKLGIPHQNWQRWESGTVDPGAEHLRELLIKIEAYLEINKRF